VRFHPAPFSPQDHIESEERAMPIQKRPMVEVRVENVERLTPAEQVAAKVALDRAVTSPFIPTHTGPTQPTVATVPAERNEPTLSVAAAAVAASRPLTPAEQVAAKLPTVIAQSPASVPTHTGPSAPGAERPLTPAEQVAAKVVAAKIQIPPLVQRPGSNVPLVTRPSVTLPLIRNRAPIHPSRPSDRPGGGGAVTVNPHTPDGWPIHLTAQVLLQPGASGQAPALQSLRSPVGRWLVIEEVKFEVETLSADNTDSASPISNASCIGSVIAASLLRGRNHITRGYVPVSMFGPVENSSAEKILFYEDATNVGLLEEYSWRPPVPIIVAPGDVLSPSFEHRGLYGFKSRIRVSYAGKLYKDKPQGYEILPYVAAWTSAPLDLSGTESEDISTEKDLLNPSEDRILTVVHMVGRALGLWQSAATGGIVTISEICAGDGSAWFDTMKLGYQTGVKISTSWGNPVVPEYLPFPAVFDFVDRKLDMEHIVPPENYFTVSVKSGGLAMTNSQAMAMFSIIGHREVKP
jgi:hypothetical protein